MQGLNPKQREAVTYLSGPSLVLAGAGSGKTRVITAKIAHLIEHAQMPAKHIYAVTFTNKAAREMKERVAKLLQGDAAKGLNISTFHTLGLNMLRRELKAAGLRRGFSIMDEQDVEQLLKELSKKNDTDKKVLQQARWQISNWKNDLILPEQAIAEATDHVQTFQALLYAAYQEALRAYNAVDFDDLILKPVELLKADAKLRERWQNRVRHLLVDEYQDTNGAQYELVKLLVGVTAALTVVGDDDQSIYAWRGAKPENLIRLNEDYPQLNVIKLEQNYRSTGRILNSANKLIANNNHVFEKQLWSELGPGEVIRVISCADEMAEAERVASELVQHKFNTGRDFGDYAILYRGNHQARLFEQTLRTNKVPYFVSGGTSFFSRTEVKDAMSYLRLLNNTDDDAAFLRIINTPRREIGHTTIEKLSTYAAQAKCSLFDAIDHLGLAESVSGKSHARLRQFREWMIELQQESENEPAATVVKQLLSDIDYKDWLSQTSPNDKAADKRWENVEALIAWITKLQEEDGKNLTLPELTAHLALMDMLERQDDDAANEQVALMTLHAAKGLEFPVVFLVGFEEGLLPHQSSIDEDNIEEERRLAYVGVTRAQRELIVTNAKKRKRGGDWTACEPSRFIAELPSDDLRHEGLGAQLSKEEKQERGNARLANLRAMLGG